MGVVGSCAHISLKKLASAVGQSRDSVVRVLGEMIQNGYLGPDAYIDYSVGYLVLEPAATFSQDEQDQWECCHPAS
jgi:DNA-binding IclR family transcriptional regulator